MKHFIFLFFVLFSTSAFGQFFTGTAGGDSVTISLSDCRMLVAQGSKTVIKKNAGLQYIVDQDIETVGEVSSSLIPVTSSKAQGGFKRNQEVYFSLDFIEQITKSSGKAVIQTKDAVIGKFICKETYAEVIELIPDLYNLVSLPEDGDTSDILTWDGDSWDAAEPAAAELPYLVYTALLTQTDTLAPVAIVLQNTLGGDVVWSRDDEGVFLADVDGTFDPAKVWYTQPPNYQGGVALEEYGISIGIEDNNTIYIITYTKPIGSGNTDGILLDTPIEIRIYPQE